MKTDQQTEKMKSSGQIVHAIVWTSLRKAERLKIYLK